jgi:hypothetical protein
MLITTCASQFPLTGCVVKLAAQCSEETDRPWTWMVVDGERFSFDEVERMYARYQKE